MVSCEGSKSTAIGGIPVGTALLVPSERFIGAAAAVPAGPGTPGSVTTLAWWRPNWLFMGGYRENINGSKMD
jgi:hypothetical protein